MTARDLRQWLAAVKRCEKQDYHSGKRCALCLLACRYGEDECWGKCILGTYLKEKHPRTKLHPGWPCLRLVASDAKVGIYAIDQSHWTIPRRRRILSDIRAWIEAQLKEKRS